MKIRFVSVMLLLSTLSGHATGGEGSFASGRSQFSVVAGNAYAFDSSYFVIGGSVSYYLADGLGVGLSLENWSGDGPAIRKYAPFAQYVFLPDSTVRPYAGLFYRHTTIEGLPSLRSAGGRAGVLMASGANAHLSFGVVYESYLDCQASVYRVCSETFPEVNLIFGF